MQKSLFQHFSRYILFLLLTVSGAYAYAADAVSVQDIVTIKDAWVRPTNPGQEVGAAYMTLSSTQDATLVSVEIDAAKNVEIHTMTMQGGVMKMRRLEALPLTAGKPYKLAPGGFHLMLFDLKKPLTAGEQVNFVLHFKTKNKVEFKQNLKAMVQTSAEGTDSTDVHKHQY